ncbi:hypothetical protein [Cylindrospermum sp. FACHB-282]|uniref:hypothetical protein n=1 Tax=Cylindrospermum sp. FACHB-282 TaxID=2692794 RepID=UPI0016895606|nr:hypothetical protein [Cylindrospermum sp. FACHB-282]MBD2388756.1 hypothetical protein [Cylindrospermum sp. FACHB-282]
MTITVTKPKLQVKKPTNKKQLSKNSTDIGTPQVPLGQVAVKQEHELLCDWGSAS